MLNANVEILAIDYEKSIMNLMERTLQKLDEKADIGMAVRLLRKLGNSAPAVFCSLIQYMTDAEKAGLICELVNQYQKKLVDMVNDALASHELGKNIELGKMFFRTSGTGLHIYAQNVKVDYRGILDNGTVQKKVEDTVQQYADRSILGKVPGLSGLLKENANTVAKMAVSLAPGEVEKKALKIIESPENKRKMTALLEAVFEKEGLVVDIGQINILYTDAMTTNNTVASKSEAGADKDLKEPMAEENPGFALSEEMEEIVLDALSEYLKASV